MISPGQAAYVDDRFIGESDRLMTDIFETANLEKIEVYLLAIHYEKTFDFLKCFRKIWL